MIRHLFLIIWNQKRRNIGLILEIFLSFMVLFAVLTFVINKYNFYRQPLGFEYENIWAVRQDFKGAKLPEIRANRELIRQRLKNFPEIESFTFSQGNIPYGSSTWRTTLKIDDQDINVDQFALDEGFLQTLGVDMVEGRWFSKEDAAANYKPIVINKQLKEMAFGEEKAEGEFLNSWDENPMQVIGVIDNYKYKGEFVEPQEGFFEYPDSNFYGGTILLKVRPNADAQFEEELVEALNNVASNWSFDIAYMDEMRKSRLRETKIPMLVFGIISVFLVFNVALGLFGVLWYNINKRKQEIGIRRAMGASKNGIGWQFVGEVLVIATLSLALGTFFAIQFPLLNVFEVQFGVYLTAIIAGILLIYSLVIICSLYPSRQAATVQPAVALHAE